MTFTRRKFGGFAGASLVAALAVARPHGVFDLVVDFFDQAHAQPPITCQWR